MPDGLFGYRMYRNTDTADTVTLAIVRQWRTVYDLHDIAELRQLNPHVVCHWMLPESAEFVSSELEEVSE